MADAFPSYEQGLKKLLEWLGEKHSRYLEALTLQARLLENIGQTRFYGDTEARRAERAQIMEVLNQLSLETTGKSFDKFARPVNMNNSKPQMLVDRVHEAIESLNSICDFLRGLYEFPSKQVVDDLFTVLEQIAQLIKEVKEQPISNDLSSELSIKEVLGKVDKQLQLARTQTRILRQLNGKWNTIAEMPDIDPLEKLVTCLNELVDLLNKLLLLLQ